MQNVIDIALIAVAVTAAVLLLLWLVRITIGRVPVVRDSITVDEIVHRKPRSRVGRLITRLFWLVMDPYGELLHRHKQDDAQGPETGDKKPGRQPLESDTA